MEPFLGKCIKISINFIPKRTKAKVNPHFAPKLNQNKSEVANSDFAFHRFVHAILLQMGEESLG